MSDPRAVDVLVEPNPGCEELDRRFFALGPRRPISRVFCEGADGEERWHRVEGRSAGGVPCPACAVEVEDSGDGTALLVYGAEWGLHLEPEDGGAAFGAPCLLLPVRSAPKT